MKLNIGYEFSDIIILFQQLATPQKIYCIVLLLLNGDLLRRFLMNHLGMRTLNVNLA